MCILIKYTICEILVEIQHFRHEWSLKTYENIPKKCNKTKGRSITCIHIWHVNISKCVCWLDTYCVKFWWYVLPNANTAHFCDIVIRNCYHSITIFFENQKSVMKTTCLKYTFPDYVFDRWTYFQMWRQVMERSLINSSFTNIRFLKNFPFSVADKS